MVWESLTSKTVSTQALLKRVNTETFLERYGAQAWPNRKMGNNRAVVEPDCTPQVGLPILNRQQGIAEMLRHGTCMQGLLAISGPVNDEQSPRDQLDVMYTCILKKLYRPPMYPWLVNAGWFCRPALHHQIAEHTAHLTPVDIISALAAC